MDAADRAQIEQQADIDRALKRRRHEPPRVVGRCMFCDEPAAERFCDSYCREDYIRLELKLENDRIVGGGA